MSDSARKYNQARVKDGWNGFALPTVLVSSVIMLVVLVAAVSFTVAVRTSVEEERYNTLAGMAAESGTAYAQACLEENDNVVTWSDANPLKPNTDCNGNTVVGASAYVLEPECTAGSSASYFRTYFEVPEPEKASDNSPISVKAKGYVQLLRKSTCATTSVVWKTYQNSDLVALGGQNDGTPVGNSLDGYWTTPPQGYLLEDGSCKKRADYPRLFSVIGSINFGTGVVCAGDEFNLPDSRGRVAINISSNNDYDVLGWDTNIGEKTHALTTTEMPAHTHDYGGYTITWGGGVGSVVYFKQVGETHRVDAIGGAATDTNGLYTCQGCTDWEDTANAGSGTPHSNLKPYIVALRVIKY